MKSENDFVNTQSVKHYVFKIAGSEGMYVNATIRDTNPGT